MSADKTLADLIDVASWMLPLYATSFLVGAATSHAARRSRPDNATALLWLVAPPSVWCLSFFASDHRWVTRLNLILEPLLLGGSAAVLYAVAGLGQTGPLGRRRTAVLFSAVLGLAAAMGTLLPPLGEAS